MDVLICSKCKSFNVSIDSKSGCVTCLSCNEVMGNTNSKIDFYEYISDKKKKEQEELEKQTKIGNTITVKNNTFFTLTPKKFD